MYHMPIKYKYSFNKPYYKIDLCQIDNLYNVNSKMLIHVLFKIVELSHNLAIGIELKLAHLA